MLAGGCGTGFDQPSGDLPVSAWQGQRRELLRRDPGTGPLEVSTRHSPPSEQAARERDQFDAEPGDGVSNGKAPLQRVGNYSQSGSGSASDAAAFGDLRVGEFPEPSIDGLGGPSMN